MLPKYMRLADKTLVRLIIFCADHSSLSKVSLIYLISLRNWIHGITTKEKHNFSYLWRTHKNIQTKFTILQRTFCSYQAKIPYSYYIAKLNRISTLDQDFKPNDMPAEQV